MPAGRTFARVAQLSLLAGICFGGTVRAEDNAFTVYGSIRDGGSFTDANTDQTLSIDGSGAVAASLDWGLDGARQVQVFLSRQQSHLGIDQSPPTQVGSQLPLNVWYLHLGGTVFFDGEIGRGGYLVGGLGATLFEPAQSGYSDELRASMNLGLGYQLPLGERLALRFEARGYLTLVNSSGGLFCSGGCVVAIKGDAVTQAEVQLGLSYRY
jgi:hypothetical protein